MRASSFEAAAGSRRGAAAEVLGLADRLTTLATVRSPLKRLLRNMFLRVVGALPFVMRRIELGLSGLSRAVFARVPPVEVRGGLPPRTPESRGGHSLTLKPRFVAK